MRDWVKKYNNGKLYAYQDNDMSLSCRVEIELENGYIIDIYKKGMPRANNEDYWFNILENKSKGLMLRDCTIEKVLKYNGKNNVVVKWISN